MSQRDRIAKLNEIDTMFRIQNDRYGCNARIPDQSVRPMMSRVDNEVVSSYEQNLNKNFETMDSNPLVKYLLPDYEPNILPQKFTYITEEEGEKEQMKIDAKIAALVPRTTLMENNITACYQAIERIKTKRNNGTITEAVYDAKLKKINEALEKFTKVLEKINTDVQALIDEKSYYDKYRDENNVAYENIIEHNKDERQKYEILIQDLNDGGFDLEKRPDETEEQYVNRIKISATYANPDDQLINAMNKVRTDFRLKMKELITDVSKIGQVEAGIEPPANVECKFEILKRWTIFKTKFVSIYGVDNKRVNATDIIDFMKAFLEGKDKLIYENSNKLSYKVDNQSKTMTIFNNETDGKMLFLRVISENYTNLALLYSFTGEPKTFKQYLEKHIPPSRKTADVRSGKSADDIEFETGITLFKLMKLFGITTKVFNVNAFCKKITEKPYSLPMIDSTNIELEREFYTLRGHKHTMLGMGLNNEEIPNNCEFGDIRILAKKLFYENVLSIRDRNGYSIKGYKTIKVSEQFVRLIMNLLKRIYPTQSDISMLKTGEKDVYNHLIHLANLTKTVPNQKDVSIKNLKERYKLLEAEIEIGNNSPLIKQELTDVLHKLKDFKVITPSQLKNYMKQI